MKTESRKLREQLLARIEAFCAAHEMSEHEFGRLAANNHRLIARIRDGIGSLSGVDKVEAFMDNHDLAKLEAATSDAA